MANKDLIALIPARSGSERIPGKNIRYFFGHPLMAYTIKLATKSGLFREVYVSSDSEEYLATATCYGAKPILRPPEISTSESPDQLWIEHALNVVGKSDFAILRPTNPFRTIEMLRRACNLYDSECKKNTEADTYLYLRAVQICKEHPYKMWENIGSNQLNPAFARDEEYLLQTKCLPAFYVQNGSLEIRPGELYPKNWPLTYTKTVGFLTQGYEGFDINTEDDCILAEELVKRGYVELLKL
ncbi:MAG: acylneuraminate cytidylyltransferase family protein [Candidatus Omnitrophica bacterium]|nr:acylneuraminate cytidylyltransferase family protein [Candidatus Omnitrophota bacterium]